MKSSERRMKLILLLQQSKHRLTVNEIAERFNISRRTVFRDFNALSELNVPVTWDEFQGYGIMPGYKIPPLMFTTRELATVMIGLNFVKSQVDQTMIEDAEGVELKIRELLPGDLRDFMESLGDRTIVDPFLHFGISKKAGGNWYLISNAISENKQLEFSYMAKDGGKETKRIVDPYLLAFYRDHWNVIGYSHKRNDFRNFILDRISEIRILEDHFSPQPNIKIEDLIFRNRTASDTVEVNVSDKVIDRFESNVPARILEKKPAVNGWFRITFLFDNLDFINEWLLQFPLDVQIIGPELLIQKRNALLRSMMA